MITPDVKLYGTNDGVVHWGYPIAGLLLVCGARLKAEDGDVPWPSPPPTCLRCIAIVQEGKQGDAGPWSIK